MYRQLNVVFFWVDFTKKLAEKNSLNGVIVKIVIYKKLKTQRKSFRISSGRCLN